MTSQLQKHAKIEEIIRIIKNPIIGIKNLLIFNSEYVQGVRIQNHLGPAHYCWIKNLILSQAWPIHKIKDPNRTHYQWVEVGTGID